MLDFRWMLSPWIIRVVFVLGCVACLGGFFFSMGLAIRDHQVAWIAAGIAVLLLGPLVVRLVCESSILFFRINETLNDMQETLANIYALIYGEVVEDDEE